MQPQGTPGTINYPWGTLQVDISNNHHDMGVGIDNSSAHKIRDVRVGLDSDCQS